MTPPSSSPFQKTSSRSAQPCPPLACGYPQFLWKTPWTIPLKPSPPRDAGRGQKSASGNKAGFAVSACRFDGWLAPRNVREWAPSIDTAASLANGVRVEKAMTLSDRLRAFVFVVYGFCGWGGETLRGFGGAAPNSNGLCRRHSFLLVPGVIHLSTGISSNKIFILSKALLVTGSL